MSDEDSIDLDDTARRKRRRRLKRKRRRLAAAARAAEESSYVCPTCGESIVIPLDRSQGIEQQYVEDCPVCCHPNLIHVEWFDDSDSDPPRVFAEAES